MSAKTPRFSNSYPPPPPPPPLSEILYPPLLKVYQLKQYYTLCGHPHQCPPLLGVHSFGKQTIINIIQFTPQQRPLLNNCQIVHTPKIATQGGTL